MGRETTSQLPNCTITTREYNTNNRLISLITQNREKEILTSFLYSYDKIGNKLSVKEEDGGITHYTYDGASRLTSTTYPERPNHPAHVQYIYDPAGNRIKTIEDDKTIHARYNNANQLLQAGDITYSYDSNGNRVSKEDQQGISRYSYSPDNFLASFTSPEKLVTNYSYDAIGRRVGKNSTSQTENCLYDGLEVLQERIAGNYVTDATYSRARGKLISKQFQNQQSDNHFNNLFYHHDALGSVIGLSDGDGKLATRYRYDAYGELLEGDITHNQYTFTEQRIDPESNLYHFHFRQYDAQAGVWTTPDPIGILGGVNLYQYVNSNPVNTKDWLGLTTGGGLSLTADKDEIGSKGLETTYAEGSNHSFGDPTGISDGQYGAWPGYDPPKKCNSKPIANSWPKSTRNKYSDPIKGLKFGFFAARYVVVDTLSTLALRKVRDLALNGMGFGMAMDMIILTRDVGRDMSTLQQTGKTHNEQIKNIRESVFGD